MGVGAVGREEMIELEDDRVLTVSEFKMRGRGSGVELTPEVLRSGRFGTE